MIELSVSAVRAIKQHARETFPDECCGFLLGTVGEPVRVEKARRAKNIATEDRPRRYEIDPLELLHADDEARTRGLDLVGIYHSHPNHPAAPSEFDRSRASPWYAYLIVEVAEEGTRELTVWRFDESTREFRQAEILGPGRRAPPAPRRRRPR